MQGRSRAHPTGSSTGEPPALLRQEPIHLRLISNQAVRKGHVLQPLLRVQRRDRQPQPNPHVRIGEGRLTLHPGSNPQGQRQHPQGQRQPRPGPQRHQEPQQPRPGRLHHLPEALHRLPGQRPQQGQLLLRAALRPELPPGQEAVADHPVAGSGRPMFT